MGNREKIVDAALHSFTHKGFHQTSMRDIAQAAGVSVGNLYNHFSGKEALIGEIALLENGVFAEFAAALRREKAAERGAVGLFHRLSRFCRRTGQCATDGGDCG